MLENNKAYEAKITNFKVGIAKTGSPYLAIDFDVEGFGISWFGMPMKKDGTINNLFQQQIAAAGFDFSRNSFSDLSKGYGNNILNEAGKVKIRAVNKMNGMGVMEWSVGWIGDSKSASSEEIAKVLPANFDDIFKANAPKSTRPTEDMIPF